MAEKVTCEKDVSANQLPMSESRRTTTDGGETDPLNVDELFDSEDADGSVDESADDRTSTPGTATTSPEVQDTTAGELFAQLREDHAEDAAETVTDEPPEAIMARADEEAEHVDDIDDAIRPDEGAFDDLLLTGRREADGFLWVESEDDSTGEDDFGAIFESAGDQVAGSRDEDAPVDAAAGEDAPLDAAAGEAPTAAESAGEDATVDSTGTTDETADDDFELAVDVDDSFEERAVSFDDLGQSSGSTEESFDGGSGALESGGDAGRSDDDRDEGESVDAHDGGDDGGESSGSGGGESDDEDSLTGRIQSILSE